jgi:hypothetical protein
MPYASTPAATRMRKQARPGEELREVEAHEPLRDAHEMTMAVRMPSTRADRADDGVACRPATSAHTKSGRLDALAADADGSEHDEASHDPVDGGSSTRPRQLRREALRPCVPIRRSSR